MRHGNYFCFDVRRYIKKHAVDRVSNACEKVSYFIGMGYANKLTHSVRDSRAVAV